MIIIWMWKDVIYFKEDNNLTKHKNSNEITDYADFFLNKSFHFLYIKLFHYVDIIFYQFLINFI